MQLKHVLEPAFGSGVDQTEVMLTVGAAVAESWQTYEQYRFLVTEQNPVKDEMLKDFGGRVADTMGIAGNAQVSSVAENAIPAGRAWSPPAADACMRNVESPARFEHGRPREGASDGPAVRIRDADHAASTLADTRRSARGEDEPDRGGPAEQVRAGPGRSATCSGVPTCPGSGRGAPLRLRAELDDGSPALIEAQQREDRKQHGRRQQPRPRRAWRSRFRRNQRRCRCSRESRRRSAGRLHRSRVGAATQYVQSVCA